MPPTRNTSRRSRVARTLVWRLTSGSSRGSSAWGWWKVRYADMSGHFIANRLCLCRTCQTVSDPGRLQLHGLRDVQAEPARRAWGRPEACLWGQEGQADRAATLHPEIQDHLCGVGQEGEKVCHVLYFLFRQELTTSSILKRPNTSEFCGLLFSTKLTYTLFQNTVNCCDWCKGCSVSTRRLDEALSPYLGAAQEITEEVQQDMEMPLPVRKCPNCGRDMVLKRKREGNRWDKTVSFSLSVCLSVWRIHLVEQPIGNIREAEARLGNLLSKSCTVWGLTKLPSD